MHRFWNMEGLGAVIFLCDQVHGFSCPNGVGCIDFAVQKRSGT